MTVPQPLVPIEELDLSERLTKAQEVFEKSCKPSSQHNEYMVNRATLLKQEDMISWDRPARNSASRNEVQAARIIYLLREYERENTFGNMASEDIPDPETRDMGGQFLTNKDRIENDSKIFKIAQQMPKGCHLHLHFNAELQPERLLLRARLMKNMFIRSLKPLINKEAMDTTELVFNVMPDDTPTSDIFSTEYNFEFKTPGSRPWMRWTTFCEEFENRYNDLFEIRSIDQDNIKKESIVMEENGLAHFDDHFDQEPLKLNLAETWVKNKMVLSEFEAYGMSQTVNGVWARFNQATRCFKGLLNYKKVFRWYIGQAIDRMIEEKIMYAELRPMLMDKFIPTDEGAPNVTHQDQMDIILEEVAKKQAELKKQNRLNQFPFGLKIIYCTPRSIPKQRMLVEMRDCINLKLQYPDLICGFDLVGAEDRANHIGYYHEELVSFTKACKELGIDIPFMFHAGETLLDTGGSRDPANSNLYDAVLLRSKRIGHGFSLVKHPHLIEEFKKRDICIELCPISNELLHLCRNIKEHPYPQILAAGIPCTVNSDNPSLFSNSLSHEFYQIMVGTPTMNIHGWRQLAEWSITYSCLSDEEKKKARKIFKDEWERFCQWIIDEYAEDNWVTGMKPS